jgi:hypothetical protein
MDLSIEANRNSALFNTMQDVLDVYNPLLHKARPTVVNQTKQRIRTPASTWGNNLDRWNGSRTARFNMPRIGSLVDATVKVAFSIPGEGPSDAQIRKFGHRGYAHRTLTTGGLINTDTTDNNARGRLDRVYADRLLGLNMIRSYVVSSKSREIFRATGEYLLARFSQMDDTMKEAVMRSTTPVDLMSASVDDTFYAPYTTYQMAIPLFMFFNEHISNAIDVNFSEEVHIDIEFRAPSELFYYGNIGDLNHVPVLAVRTPVQLGGLQQKTATGETEGLIAWDQSTSAGSTNTKSGTTTSITMQNVNDTGACAAAGSNTFGTSTLGSAVTDVDAFTVPIEYSIASAVLDRQLRHIQGVSSPLDAPAIATVGTNNFVGTAGYYKEAGYVHSSTTFAYPDVDNNGESISIQVELNCDYIIQDTDAYRALRAETFPAGTGFTSIVFNTSQEVFSNLMAYENSSQNILDFRAGGTFVDPGNSRSGITVGDSTRFVDLQLRDNHLTFATHFMVRKHSDMGGDGTVAASKTVATYGKTVTTKVLGAHRIRTRCLPVHYFQVLAAGRVIYESDGKTQLALTQSAMYNGTGKDWGSLGSNLVNGATVTAYDSGTINARPFNIYTINWGLSASRLENTGCISFQNLNNPTLRIYFKPETWAEHQVELDSAGTSEAKKAAARGVQVEVIHEHFNVITVNSGNGEITSGMNQ